jgi:hypothetical protein
MEERVRELVARGALAPTGGLPRLGVVRKLVAEGGVPGAERVQHPAGAALDGRRDQGCRSHPTASRRRTGARPTHGRAGCSRVKAAVSRAPSAPQ